MNGRRLIIGTALLLLLTGACYPSQLMAQPPVGPPRDGRGDRGGRDPFFEAMREAFRDLTPNRELMELLWHSEVRSEIGLSREKHEEIEKILRESFTQVMALRDSAAEQKLDKDEWKGKILAIQSPVDQKIMAMLADPMVAKLDRLIGIYVQNRGFRSAANAAVAKRIGLEGDDFESFRKARSELWHRLMDENRDKMSGLIREGQRDKIAQLFEEAERKLDGELSFRLTTAQKRELQELKGEPFDLPRRNPDMRGRGPRGGSGEGRPGDSDGKPRDGRDGEEGGPGERGGRPGDMPKRGDCVHDQTCREQACLAQTLKAKAGW